MCAFEQASHRFQMIGQEFIIGIEKGNEAPARVIDAGIARGATSAIILANKANSRI